MYVDISICAYLSFLLTEIKQKIKKIRFMSTIFFSKNVNIYFIFQIKIELVV